MNALAAANETARLAAVAQLHASAAQSGSGQSTSSSGGIGGTGSKSQSSQPIRMTAAELLQELYSKNAPLTGEQRMELVKACLRPDANNLDGTQRY